MNPATLTSLHNRLLAAGITFSQLMILLKASDEIPCSMGDVARLLGVTTAAVTGRVDYVEKMGWVERFRESGERRKIFIGLTAKGTDVLNKVLAG